MMSSFTTAAAPSNFLAEAAIAILLLLAIDSTNAAPEDYNHTITAALSSNIAKDVKHFLSHRQPSEVTNYKSRYARRSVISFVLLRQALALGGLNDEINIRTEKVFQRNLNYARSGMITMIGEPVWLSAIDNSDNQFYVSTPLIRNEELAVGLYTHPRHHLIKHPPSKETLKNYSAVSNRNWKNDWELLKQLNLKSIQHSLFWRNIIKMVYAGRADFTLAPFQDTKNLTISAYGVTLKAIPDVKVVFQDSRHIVISRNHPRGLTAFNALEIGLAKLRSEGTISRAYTEAGVFNTRTSNWTSLNSTPAVNIPTTSDHQEFDNLHRDHLHPPLQP